MKKNPSQSKKFSILQANDDQSISQTLSACGLQEQLALEKIIELGNVEIKEGRYIDHDDFLADLDA